MRCRARFAARLHERIRYNAAVTEIRKTAGGVRIAYTTANGNHEAIEGAYCICTIPLPVLRTIPADFSAPFAASMRRVAYTDTVKVGLAFKRRFWEEDDRIMGGISRTDQTISQYLVSTVRILQPQRRRGNGRLLHGQSGAHDR